MNYFEQILKHFFYFKKKSMESHSLIKEDRGPKHKLNEVKKKIKTK